MASNSGKPSMKKEASQTMRQLDKKKGGKTEEPFPTTLEGFNYGFNEKGQLRHLENEGPFEFAVSENRSYNQKHYEALGEVITEKVYELLETQGKLKKHFIPTKSKKTEPCSFLFMSEDALTNEDKLMVLIHGSGVVRAGQWTRKLIINEDLDKGTQLPYIKRAMEDGYGVIVLNTNLNKVTVNGKEKNVKGNESPEEHGVYVWKNFIQQSKAKHIAIVGHSYGGVVTVAMAREFLTEFQQRVFAIGFTDSVHSVMLSDRDGKVGRLFEERAVNWVTSNEPLDTPMRTRKHDAKRVSAGHEVHEWTSWSAFESVFEFFKKKYQQAISGDLPSHSTSSETKEAELEVAEEASEDREEVPMETNDHGDKKEETKMEDGAEVAEESKPQEASAEKEVQEEITEKQPQDEIKAKEPQDETKDNKSTETKESGDKSEL